MSPSSQTSAVVSTAPQSPQPPLVLVALAAYDGASGDVRADVLALAGPYLEQVDGRRRPLGYDHGRTLAGPVALIDAYRMRGAELVSLLGLQLGADDAPFVLPEVARAIVAAAEAPVEALTARATVTGQPAAIALLHLIDGRRTVRVSLPTRRATTLPQVLRSAARIIARQGHWPYDYVPDAFDREMTQPHALRPMSIVAALKCAVTGDPHRDSLLADEAIATLALRLEVDGEGPHFRDDVFRLEGHIEAWEQIPARTAASVVAVLEAAGDATEVAS
ncbi:hypothetical protein [Streptomyces sp. NPDC047315]|uniref:DUF6197 family protein n=1 Tax=Streptomyces sp. NPDC047315 TaxID=3155142 RepID=UPI0033C6F84B